MDITQPNHVLVKSHAWRGMVKNWCADSTAHARSVLRRLSRYELSLEYERSNCKRIEQQLCEGLYH